MDMTTHGELMLPRRKKPFNRTGMAILTGKRCPSSRRISCSPSLAIASLDCILNRS